MAEWYEDEHPIGQQPDTVQVPRRFFQDLANMAGYGDTCDCRTCEMIRAILDADETETT